MRLHFVSAAAVTTLLTVACAVLGASAPPAFGRSIAPNSSSSSYPGNPTAEAALVAAENLRLVDVRTTSNAAHWTGTGDGTPYRIMTGTTDTLVLTRRATNYDLDDLLAIAPHTFVREPDGSYLLLENIVVESGAILSLSSTTGLVLHLASTPTMFVSIVTIGGSLTIAGTPTNPVDVSSWDPNTQTIDNDTADGRSYFRVIGGHATLSDADFHNLGFWSGTTGGVSITGALLPDGAVTPPANPSEATIAYANSKAGLKAAREAKRAAMTAKVADPKADDPNAPVVYGTQLHPANTGSSIPSLDPTLVKFGYASASVVDVTVSHNAWGLFVSSADSVDLRNVLAEDNLVSGIVLHRNVINSRISNSRATGNALDGFDVGRGSTGLTFDRVTASRNGRDGISVDSRPLASGPSATGNSISPARGNKISNSTFTVNRLYGIDIVGGKDVVLAGNTVSDDVAGIVVRDGTDGITVSDNTVKGSAMQGIALRDGVTDARLLRNTVADARIGIYLRNASGTLSNNVITHVDSHAITVIGESVTVTVDRNTATGIGPTAIDVARAENVQLADNVSTDWTSTKPLDVVLRNIFQPLTVMWLTLALLVLLTATTGLKRRRAGIVHPYSNLTPLVMLSSGLVSASAAHQAGAQWSSTQVKVVK